MFWRQVKSLTLANMKARYRKTFAGLVWVVMNPIIMYSVQSFVFRKFLKLEIDNYSLFLLGGLLPWIFIVSTLDMCTPVLRNSGELLKAFKVNPLVIVLSQLLDNLFNFLLAFFILLVPFIIFSMKDFVGMLFLPVAFLQMVVGVCGMAWLLALLNVFYRDTKFVVQFFTSVFFFLTPIFYPVEFVPDKYRWAIEINPLYSMIAPFRCCLYNFELHKFLFWLAKGSLFSFIFIYLSYFYWSRKRNEFYHCL